MAGSLFQHYGRRGRQLTKTVNNTDRAFSKAKIKRRREMIDVSMDIYLEGINKADRQGTNRHAVYIALFKVNITLVQLDGYTTFDYQKKSSVSGRE